MNQAQEIPSVEKAPKLSNWEKIAGFTFGVVFIGIILYLAVENPDPTGFQYSTFRTILAIAAAGVGGVLAGFLEVEGEIEKLTIRAGGALALFVIVYFFAPSAPQEKDPVTQIINGDNPVVVGENRGTMNIGESKAKKERPE